MWNKLRFFYKLSEKYQEPKISTDKSCSNLTFVLEFGSKFHKCACVVIGNSIKINLKRKVEVSNQTNNNKKQRVGKLKLSFQQKKYILAYCPECGHAVGCAFGKWRQLCPFSCYDVAHAHPVNDLSCLASPRNTCRFVFEHKKSSIKNIYQFPHLHQFLFLCTYLTSHIYIIYQPSN